MRVFATAEPFDRLYILFLSFQRQDGAGINVHSVHQYRAGAATTVVARPLCAGEIQSVAQHIVKRPVRINAQSMDRAINF